MTRGHRQRFQLRLQGSLGQCMNRCRAAEYHEIEYQQQFHRHQAEATLQHQAKENQSCTEGVTDADGMQAGIKVRKPQHTDGADQQEDGAPQKARSSSAHPVALASFSITVLHARLRLVYTLSTAMVLTNEIST